LFFNKIHVFLKTAREHGAIGEGLALALEIMAMTQADPNVNTITAATTTFEQLTESIQAGITEAEKVG